MPPGGLRLIGWVAPDWLGCAGRRGRRAGVGVGLVGRITGVDVGLVGRITGVGVGLVGR